MESSDYTGRDACTQAARQHSAKALLVQQPLPAPEQSVVDPGHPRVNQVNSRETNQQKRIANGISSGKLTPTQASHLEHGEARLQKNEQRDMAANNGHLTKKDQKQLNHEANNMNKRIYNDKR